MPPPRARPWRHGDAGIIVHFRLTPKSSNDAVDGPIDTADGPAFQAHVRAIPEDGAANAALVRLAAAWLGVPRRCVSLASGGKSRLKSLAIAGDQAKLEALIEAKARSAKNENVTQGERR